MSIETLLKYIEEYEPNGDKMLQIAKIDNYDFTFYVVEGQVIGAVLDMDSEPQILIKEEFRGKGYGLRLFKGYLVENELLCNNRFVFCNCLTKAGLGLVKKFKDENPHFQVFELNASDYIITRDYRIRKSLEKDAELS